MVYLCPSAARSVLYVQRPASSPAHTHGRTSISPFADLANIPAIPAQPGITTRRRGDGRSRTKSKSLSTARCAAPSASDTATYALACSLAFSLAVPSTGTGGSAGSAGSRGGKSPWRFAAGSAIPTASGTTRSVPPAFGAGSAGPGSSWDGWIAGSSRITKSPRTLRCSERPERPGRTGTTRTTRTERTSWPRTKRPKRPGPRAGTRTNPHPA